MMIEVYYDPDRLFPNVANNTATSDRLPNDPLEIQYIPDFGTETYGKTRLTRLLICCVHNEH